MQSGLDYLQKVLPSADIELKSAAYTDAMRGLLTGERGFSGYGFTNPFSLIADVNHDRVCETQFLMDTGSDPACLNLRFLLNGANRTYIGVHKIKNNHISEVCTPICLDITSEWLIPAVIAIIIANYGKDINLNREIINYMTM